MVDFSDFTGFSFGGKSSAELGITRVSGGDRYSEELFSEIKDISVEVPGMDGEYYFGSTYGSRKMEIDFAFDSISEEQFRELRKVFGTKQIKELIFEERPYKKYMAKVESPIELSYVCFDEPMRRPSSTREGIRVTERTPRTIDQEVPKYEVDEETGEKIPVMIVDEETGEERQATEIIQIQTYDLVREEVTPWGYTLDENGQYVTERVYKGEGKISFVCYFPFAKSVYRELPVGESADWAISSGILTADERNEKEIDIYKNGIINIYNAGDVPTGFRLFVPGALSETMRITYNETDTELVIEPFDLKEGDAGFLIDTNNQLIIGLESQTISYDSNGNPTYTTTGNLYNENVTGGWFFKLEPNLKTDNDKLEITNGINGIEIFYDYLYF